MNRRTIIFEGMKFLALMGMHPAFTKSKIIKTAPLNLEDITIREIHQAYNNGGLTAGQLTQWYLDRINQMDTSGVQLNAIISINPDAMAIADQLDREWQQGIQRSPIHGIPLILKDNIDTVDAMPTTGGSLALKNSFATMDSTVAKQLRDAGAIILAKANLSEWANFKSSISSSGWSAVLGQTKNPYLLDHNPCGSSSGSAVAVSANLCTLAIGTETNGSIVCPSHANGIVGIKPTVGYISRTGIIPISFTQDTAGPMARTVRDAALCLSVLGAKDISDSKTQVPQRKIVSDYSPYLNAEGLSGKRIGVFLEASQFHDTVIEIFNAALDVMESAGATIIPLENIVETKVSNDSFNVMLHEFKDGLNRYLSQLGKDIPVHSLEELIEFNLRHPEELQYFDQELLIRSQEKGDLSGSSYQTSLSKMLAATRENGIDRVIKENHLDAIVAPTGSPAWKTSLQEGDNYLGGSSSPAAQSGYPNITLPMGFDGELPVGISIFGSAWSESKLIEIAYAFEQLTKVRRPPKFLSH